MHGWVFIDKPQDFGSFDIIRSLKKFINQRIGYSGTLDPFATGVIPVAIGDARKLLQYLDFSDKIYEFTIKFGHETDTLDKTGKIINSKPYKLDFQSLKNIVEKYHGQIEQIPPKYSNVKINGVRSHKLARQNIEFEVPKRRVKIKKLEILEFDDYNASAKLRLDCSKGTYVRSLARDMAYDLDNVCFVSELRRTGFGKFSVDDATPLKEVIAQKADISKFLHPVDMVLDDIQVLMLNDEEIWRLRNGQKLKTEVTINKEVFIYDQCKTLQAICQIEDNLLKPKKVFNL